MGQTIHDVDNARAGVALKKFCQLLSELDVGPMVLDVGAGNGKYARYIEKTVGGYTTVSTFEYVENWTSTFVGDYTTFKIPIPYDAIWCSHVLEHQLNVNLFLRKLLNDVYEDGLIAITVPQLGFKPPVNRVVSGHVTLWNAGQLLYNLVLAGCDCSEAMVNTTDYDASVIVRKKTIVPFPELTMNKGDLDVTLAKYFPFEVVNNFDGLIENVNWN
jgi:SAM-dependent methyltransferase